MLIFKIVSGSGNKRWQVFGDYVDDEGIKKLRPALKRLMVDAPEASSLPSIVVTVALPAVETEIPAWK